MALLFAFQINLTAQNSDLDLVRVEFWQPQDQIDHWIRIKEDGSNGIEISEGQKTKAWMKNTSGSISKKPVAYVSGSTPRIGACFKKTGENLTCAGADGLPAINSGFFGRATIEGIDQSGAIVFSSTLPIKPLMKIGTGNIYEYLATPVDDNLEVGVIHFFETFKVRWEWSRTDNQLGQWFDAGISENALYVTLDKPIREKPASGYSHYLTLIHIGCKYGDKASSNAALVAKVWSYFEGRQVCRADGEPLKYYGQWIGGNLGINTQELLLSKDGMCTSWAKFMLDVLKSQGFREQNNLVRVVGSDIPISSAGRGFFVKTWEETPPGTSGDSNYPYRNNKGNPFYINNAYNWSYKEVDLTSPTPAQNNINNSQSDFTNHVFVRIMGELYDPSYGSLYGAPDLAYILDPMDPTSEIEVETVPIFDNQISAFYYYESGNPSQYFIKMNVIIHSTFIYIVPAVSDEYNY